MSVKVHSYSFVLSVSEDQYTELCHDHNGVCLECGEIADCVEPDAEEYKCESCEKHAVFGLEQAMLLGNVDIV